MKMFRKKIESGIFSENCHVCGHQEYQYKKVLWQELINDWQLSDSEAEYIDRQQGQHCTNCKSNLRSIALAKAILSYFNSEKTLSELASDGKSIDTQILEINEAGNLSKTLKLFKNYHFGAYPDLDIHSIPFQSDTFDLIIHSDTLEHVPNPVHGLKECLRVLKPGGALCYTVPIVISRLNRNRAGLKSSYHGNSKTDANDFTVQTEYGADFWTQLIEAGFDNVSIITYEYPSGISIVAKKSIRPFFSTR